MFSFAINAYRSHLFRHHRSHRHRLSYASSASHHYHRPPTPFLLKVYELDLLTDWTTPRSHKTMTLPLGEQPRLKSPKMMTPHFAPGVRATDTSPSRRRKIKNTREARRSNAKAAHCKVERSSHLAMETRPRCGAQLPTTAAHPSPRPISQKRSTPRCARRAPKLRWPSPPRHLYWDVLPTCRTRVRILPLALTSEEATREPNGPRGPYPSYLQTWNILTHGSIRHEGVELALALRVRRPARPLCAACRQ